MCFYRKLFHDLGRQIKSWSRKDILNSSIRINALYEYINTGKTLSGADLEYIQIY